MNRPFLDELLKKVDSKYILVIAAARRARQLVDGDAPTIELDESSSKPVTIALNEINENKVVVFR